MISNGIVQPKHEKPGQEIRKKAVKRKKNKILLSRIFLIVV